MKCGPVRTSSSAKMPPVPSYAFMWYVPVVEAVATTDDVILYVHICISAALLSTAFEAQSCSEGTLYDHMAGM